MITEEIKVGRKMKVFVVKRRWGGFIYKGKVVANKNDEVWTIEGGWESWKVCVNCLFL